MASQAILADVTTTEAGLSSAKLGAIMGAQIAYISFGFFIGALLAGRLIEYGLRFCYTASSAVSILAIMLLLLRMPETLEVDGRKVFNKFVIKKQILESPVSCLRLVTKRGKEIRKLAFILIILSFPFNMGDFFYIYSTQHWGLSPKSFSNFIAMFGLAGIVSNICASILMPKMGIKRYSGLSMFSAILMPLGACFSFKLALIGGALGFLGSSQMLGISATLTTVGTEKLGMARGELAGERAALTALVKVFGPLFYSSLYLQGSKLFGLPSLPFAFNILLSVVALFLGQRYL